jgi:hypothetical protein
MFQASLLEHPEAQALLADAAVRGCRDRLTAFLRRYLLRLFRLEQRAGRGRRPGQAQQAATQDLRTDCLPCRPPAQAGAALRRFGHLGRRGRDG